MRVFATMVCCFVAGVALAAPPKSLQKTRAGSMLKHEAHFDAAGDLRGDAEKKRDQELVVHYRRLAELDALASLASKSDDFKLLERIEDVRRKETQRHYKALMRLRIVSQQALASGTQGEQP